MTLIPVRIAESIAQYARHDPDCRLGRQQREGRYPGDSEAPCTCGLTVARAAFQGAVATAKEAAE